MTSKTWQVWRGSLLAMMTAAAMATNGGCNGQCNGALQFCGNTCTDTVDDSANCGECGNACAKDQRCYLGACEPACFVDRTLPDCPGGVGGMGGAGGQGTGGAAGAGGGEVCVPAVELCDGVDNDCNGKIDDVPGGCECVVGEGATCYTGPNVTEGVGQCKAGIRDCNANGQWGPCMGEIVPKEEVCNLLDDDCNGTTDDGLGTSICGVGECQVIVQKCMGGMLQTCVPGQSTPEVCDGLDNDCNGTTDDGLGTSICGVGECQVIVQKCMGGMLQTCVPGQSTPEVCDGLDNDCDGTVDDGNPGGGDSCFTGLKGVCAAGTTVCNNGMLSCSQTNQPSAELCDGLDNNCDGLVDNGLFDIACGIGACATTVPACVNGVPNVCNPLPAQVETCDGIDNDCDGTVDDGNPGDGAQCPTGLMGVCAAGTTVCNNGMLSCSQMNQPSAEVCDGLDNDCNGTVDDGNPGGGAACGCGGTTACVSGTLDCTGGAVTYFSEDFSDNTAGWMLGTEWQIGPAMASSGCQSSPGQDPAQDHTATADNGVAGQVIGGCTTTILHADYCIESPTIDLSVAPGSVYLSFWRHLHSDYPTYVTNRVQAFNGSVWVDVWVQSGAPYINDTQWTNAAGTTQFNITAIKNANFRVRWCSNVGQAGAFSGGGWSLDDVVISSAICP